jgi:hypothetical protein
MAETPINWKEAFDKLRAWEAEGDAILRALSDIDPIVSSDYDSSITRPTGCFFCSQEESPDGGFVTDHTDDCIWARARKLFPPAPASPEPTSPEPTSPEPKVKELDLDRQAIPGVPPGFPDPWAD